jgi:hypothetical protein
LWAVALCAVLMAGCDKTERDWENARRANTVGAYNSFVASHPKGPHVEEAALAVENLEWEDARKAHTSAAYAAFLGRHGDGAHAGDARAAKAALDSVERRTYVTSNGDEIAFGPDGRALERNGLPGMIYAGQMISFDSEGRMSGTPCTYKQEGMKVRLDCGGQRAEYTMAADGALEGPAAGLFRRPAFARLVERK